MSEQNPLLPFELPINSALQEVLGSIPIRHQPATNPVMDETEVERILRLAVISGIQPIVDGGWAVDALLGWQTREHQDLDLVLNHQQVPPLLHFLSKLGYQHLPRGEQWEYHFFLEDDRGHQVDLRTYVTDAAGEIIGGVVYPSEALTGKGRIAQMDVACVDAHYLIASHQERSAGVKDCQALRYLCNLFKIDLPVELSDTYGK